jgi:hypothetical protein
MSPKSTARAAAADTVTVSIDLTATEAAWKKQDPRARALDPKAVNPARVDVTLAAAIALAGVRNVLVHRDALTAAFRDPPLAVLDRLPEVCLAAQHADLLHRAAEDPAAPFVDILPRMTELRGLLLDDLAVQARRKRCPQKTVDDIRAGDNSVRDKANDLNDLAAWYRAHWAEVAGKTAVEADEVKEAGQLAAEALARLGAVVAARTPKAGEMSPAELRRRAFTLLLEDYEVVRRHGAFLFSDAEGGWERYVPSLWSGKRSGEPAKRDAAKGGEGKGGEGKGDAPKPA